MQNGNIKFLGREAFWVATGLGVNMLLVLIGTRVLTTLMTTEEYGRLALSLSFTTLAVQVGVTPISLTTLRFYAYWREAGRLKILFSHMSTYLSFSLLLVLIVSAVFAVVSRWVIELAEIEIILLTGIFSMLLMLYTVALGLENAARETRRRALLQISFELARFSLAVCLIWMLHKDTAEVVLGGFLIAALLVVVPHFFSLYRRYKTVWQKGNDSKLIDNKVSTVTLSRFLLPLFLSYACIWIVMTTERWALQYYGSVADVGGYAAVYQLAYIPMILIGNFLLLLTAPIIYQYIGANKNSVDAKQSLKVNRHLTFVIVGITFCGFIMLELFHPYFGKLLLGPNFRVYSWIFPWLFLAGGCFAAAQQLLLKLSCEMRTLPHAFLWGAVAIAAIISYMISARIWQLTGLVVSVVAINLLLLIFAVLISFVKQESGDANSQWYTSTLKYKLIAMIQTYHNRMLMRRKVKVRNKVFCIGLNKTGTTSWAKAMRALGYVVGSETKATMYFYDWVNGDYSNIIDYCRTDGEAFQDVPFSLPGTFQELDAAFPESKFVLTIRESAEQWYNSVIRFHGKHWSSTGRVPPSPEDLARTIYLKKGFPADFCHNVYKTPISDPYNREKLLEFYKNYNAEIVHYFKNRPGDLLVLNVAEPQAFSNLCEFLGLPLVTDMFPWENKH